MERNYISEVHRRGFMYEWWVIEKTHMSQGTCSTQIGDGLTFTRSGAVRATHKTIRKQRARNKFDIFTETVA